VLKRWISNNIISCGMQKGRRLHSEAATEYLHTDADSSIIACRFVFSFVVSKRACASLTRTLVAIERARERESLQ
jgi:hypothetical protein